MTPRVVEVPLPRTVRLPTEVVPTILPPHTLAVAARADGSRHDLAGRRVRVLLSGAGGLERVEGDGIALAEGLGIDGAAGANLLVGPRGARRECFSRTGSLLESIQLPEALPGIAVQWAVPGAAGAGSPRVRVRARLLPDAGQGEVRIHRAPGLVWVSRGRGGVLLGVAGRTEDTGEPALGASPEVLLRGGMIDLAWDLLPGTPDAPLTLLLLAAPPEGAWAALPALAGVTAHHRRGEAAAWGEGETGVELQTGVEEMDEGVRRLRSWTRDRLLVVPGSPQGIHPPLVPPDPSSVPFPEELAPWLDTPCLVPWTALGAAASGDWETGRAALAALPWDDPHPALLSALALAQWTAWTGETGPLAANARRLTQLLAPARSHRGVEPRAVTDIRRAVAAAGEASEIAALAGLAGPGSAEPSKPARAGLGVAAPVPAPEGGTAGGLRLPLARGTSPVPAHLLLAAGREAAGVRTRLGEALHLRTGLGSVARAPHLAAQGWGGALLWELVSGILGAVPDAAYGRLTLSPLLPPNWTRFVARGVRAGEGALEMAYDRSGGHVAWTLRPLEGSVPLMVVFEPWQPLSQVRAVRVDGAPAELELLEEDGWTRVKVQLPADSVRVLEVEGEALSPP